MPRRQISPLFAVTSASSPACSIRPDLSLLGTLAVLSTCKLPKNPSPALTARLGGRSKQSCRYLPYFLLV